MSASSLRRSLVFLFTLSCSIAVSAAPLGAQTQQRPGARGQTPPRPAAPRQPANPQRPPAQPAAKTPEPPPPPKPVAQDLRMKAVYTTGDQKTESVMQQSLASHATLSGVTGQGGPSFDAALGEALQNAAKAVAENLKTGNAKKK